MATLFVQLARCPPNAVKAGQSMSNKLRVGIYSGTFNPVHSGHVTFALQALESAKLDIIYFMPERRPRQKQHVEHYGHRVAMITRALKPHPRLDVLETDDVSFTVARTFTRLQQRFQDAELVFLMGSDVVSHLHTWPAIDKLLTNSELVVGLRAGTSVSDLWGSLATLPITNNRVHMLYSYAPNVSSTEVRQGIRERRHAPGMLYSVAQYSNRNWLYVALS
jgi:nicotinate-nucleotide adenylyltransferase